MIFKIMITRISGPTYLVLFLLACNQASKHSDSLKAIDASRGDTDKTIVNVIKTTDTTSTFNERSEEDIIDTIFKLPEILERAKYIEVQMKGRNHLKVWIAGTPVSLNQKYYWIKAGEDNGSSLVTHFNFFFYPDSTRIMYYDPESDRELTLSEWRIELSR